MSIKSSTSANSKIYLWTLFCICFFSTLFGGIVSTLMSVYLPVAVKELLGTRGAEDMSFTGAYINAAFVLGWAVGGFVWGIISDRIGRKKAVIYCVAFYGLFTMLTGYMPTWLGVVVCRSLSGFGVGGVLVATTTIMIEEWPHQSKAIFMGILSIAIPVGIFSAGVITHAVANWRIGFHIGLIPLGISLLSIPLLKESTTWENMRHEIRPWDSKATSIFSASSRPQLIAGSLIFGTMLIGLWAIFSWIPTWIQSLIVSSDGTKERSTSMMIFGMGGLTGGFLSGWLLKALDARKSLIVCFAACSLSALVLFKTNSGFSAIIYGEIAILALFFGASQGVLSVFIPELFSTSIRATATGFCFNIGRLLTAIAVLFVGVLETSLGGYGNALFVFSLVFVAGLLVTIRFKNNGGSNLPLIN